MGSVGRMLALHAGGWFLGALCVALAANLGMLDPPSGGAPGLILIFTTTTTVLAVGAWWENRRRSALEQRLKEEARIDPLTGLPNRLALEEELARALARAKRRSTLVAVAFIDLDGLKGANDRFGHAVGDHLLVATARRLRAVVRTEDVAARWGGDEFAILLPEVDSVDGALIIGRRIVEALGEPVTVDGRPLDSSASVGIAVHPDHAESGFGLIKAADRAMYEAKTAGGRRCVVALSKSSGGLCSA